MALDKKIFETIRFKEGKGYAVPTFYKNKKIQKEVENATTLSVIKVLTSIDPLFGSTQAELCDKTCIDRRRIHSIVHDLEKLEVVEIVDGKVHQGKTLKIISNRYKKNYHKTEKNAKKAEIDANNKKK